jgi:hypothetical protein
VDLQTDHANCGACGNACRLLPITAICAGGSCDCYPDYLCPSTNTCVTGCNTCPGAPLSCENRVRTCVSDGATSCGDPLRCGYPCTSDCGLCGGYACPAGATTFPLTCLADCATCYAPGQPTHHCAVAYSCMFDCTNCGAQTNVCPDGTCCWRGAAELRQSGAGGLR